MTRFSCLVLEVFPIPKMELIHGDAARRYLTKWNDIIKKFNGIGGIRVVETHHLLRHSIKGPNMHLYEK